MKYVALGLLVVLSFVSVSYTIKCNPLENSQNSTFTSSTKDFNSFPVITDSTPNRLDSISEIFYTISADTFSWASHREKFLSTKRHISGSDVKFLSQFLDSNASILIEPNAELVEKDLCFFGANVSFSDSLVNLPIDEIAVELISFYRFMCSIPESSEFFGARFFLPTTSSIGVSAHPIAKYSYPQETHFLWGLDSHTEAICDGNPGGLHMFVSSFKANSPTKLIYLGREDGINNVWFIPKQNQIKLVNIILEDDGVDHSNDEFWDGYPTFNVRLDTVSFKI